MRVQEVFTKFILKFLFHGHKSRPSGTLNHIHIWSNNWNLHQVSGKQNLKCQAV